MSISDIYIHIQNITISDITNVDIHILLKLKVQSRIIIFITFTFTFTIPHFCPSLLVFINQFGQDPERGRETV